MRYLRIIASFLLEQRAKVCLVCRDAVCVCALAPSLAPSLPPISGSLARLSLALVLKQLHNFLAYGFAKMLSLQDYAKLAGARALDETAMCGVLEHSITACIYFVPPHRIKKVDLIQMAAISQMVRELSCVYYIDSARPLAQLRSLHSPHCFDRIGHHFTGHRQQLDALALLPVAWFPVTSAPPSHTHTLHIAAGATHPCHCQGRLHD